MTIATIRIVPSPAAIQKKTRKLVFAARTTTLGVRGLHRVLAEHRASLPGREHRIGERLDHLRGFLERGETLFAVLRHRPVDGALHLFGNLFFELTERRLVDGEERESSATGSSASKGARPEMSS